MYADKLPGPLAARYRFGKGGRWPQGHDGSAPPVLEFPRKREGTGGRSPPVFVYAGLWTTGDALRMETAKCLYEEHVARLVRQV